MNQIVIRVADEKLLLSFTLASNNQHLDTPLVDFKHPFDDKALEDIRWYLEDYLGFPYGINQQKAKIVLRKMKKWGIDLFRSIFASSEKAALLYHEAAKKGLDNCEINISSDDPKILKLPWELLQDPNRTTLAFSLAGMFRSLIMIPIRAPPKPPPSDRLNILMVTSRPFGERDVGYGMVARPVLDAIKHLGNRAQLKLLRPPTFEALKRELAENKEKYHVVHFDGHGGFDENVAASQHNFAGPGQGVLLFENIDGGPEEVSARKLGQFLENNRIPFFILNACKSGAHGNDPYSSVAAQLVKTGASAVVAMAYSVFGVAAREFMKRFYSELVAGKSISEAVGQGRKETGYYSLRPSPRGDLKLMDWMVPVLYQQQKCAPFVLQNSTISFEEMSKALGDAGGYSSKLVDFPHQGRYGFIGREVDMMRLEKCYRTNQVVVLRGMGGMGKTELACGFARWLLETNGRSQAFFTSFEHGARLVNVVNQVGRFYIGDKFSQYSKERRQRIVTEHLRQNECLLILDNFESVSGHLSDGEGLLTKDERIELSEFLRDIVGGKSWTLITSRGEEEWLGCQRSGLRLGGLEGKDVTEFAKEVFAQADIDVKGLRSDYLDLLKMLNGHPLSLQVVLPRLKTEHPREVMAGLEKGLKKVDIDDDQRNKSLAASLKYSFDKLSPRVKQHLPFLCLLSGRVNGKILGWFSEGRFKAEDGEVYREFFNDALGGDEWVEALGEAASSGIVEAIGRGLFRLHPTLPWFLRQQLKNIFTKKEKRDVEAGDDFQRLEMQFIRFYKLVANDLREKLVTKDAESAMTALDFEEPNLLRQLRRADHVGDWESAQLILQALIELYKRRNRDSESVALRNRVLQSVGQTIEAAKSKGSDAFKFWMFLKGEEANDLLSCRKLEEAEKIYSELLEESIRFNDQRLIAIQYHNLGIIAQERRQWEKAKAFYEKSLRILKEIGDTQGAAARHNQLGNVANLLGRLCEAERHYHDALKFYEDSGDLYESTNAIHNLGITKQNVGKLEDSKQLFLKALEIHESVGNSRLAAADYHHYGRVCYLQGRLAEAKEFFKKALMTYEDNSLPGEAANQLHALGIIAKEESQLEEAIALWWRSWGNYMDGNIADKARGFPGESLADLLAEVGEDKFKDLWRENIEEECQDSFVEILKSIRAEAIDKRLHQLSDSDVKALSNYLNEIGEVEFKKSFLKANKAECPQWHLEKIKSLLPEKESMPSEAFSEAPAAEQAGKAPTRAKSRRLHSKQCSLQ